jgi:very-short-patch-repair endonuclease
MPSRNIVIGQKIDSVKVQRAKQLRSNMTPEEQVLWQHLRANRLDGWHFRRQQIIDGFIVDFYCHKVGLVIELDGPIHANQVEHDVERDNALSSRGLQVVRVKNKQIVQDIESVLARILEACQDKE